MFCALLKRFLNIFDGLRWSYKRIQKMVVEDLMVIFMCTHTKRACLCASVDWKSHLTLKWMLHVGDGYFNFMYLFSTLVAVFSYQDVVPFCSTFKTIHSGLLASE